MSHDNGVHMRNGISFSPEEKLHLQENGWKWKAFSLFFFSIFIVFLNSLKPRTLKPLKQTTEETFRNTDISNKFLNRTPITQETATRTDK